METHEEIIKLLTNICELVNKDNKKDEDADDESDLLDEVKQVQTILYQLWLRLLEWECLLEQQQQTPGPLQVSCADSRDIASTRLVNLSSLFIEAKSHRVLL